MQTFTGRVVDLRNVMPLDVDILDIAHHLALTNRFGGATMVPYSVADHSLRVRELVVGEIEDDEMEDFARARLEMCALLHDAAEAYWGDVVAPVKRILGDFEAETLRVVFEVVGLPVEWAAELPDVVKQADRTALSIESHVFLAGGRRVAGDWAGCASVPDSFLEDFDPPLPWDAAEDRFLEVFKRLAAAMGG